MSKIFSPGGFGESKEGGDKLVAELAQRVLDKLFYPLDNERCRIENAIKSEFEVIRSNEGWMFHESNFTDIVGNAAEVILKNTNRRPDVSENIQNIKDLLEQHKNVKKELQQYLSLDVHGLLMTAIQDPGANITATDIEEALKERGISI